ncbi:MAG: Hpt domain-containing protein [Spirochaetes bacterium]|nr:Hpt domain-containing protein [Spirochaetota bacterium]
MRIDSYNMYTAADDLGIDFDKYKSLMRAFLTENMNEYIENLRQNVVANKFDEITFYAHKIAGASANYQTDEITEKAKKIKDAAKERRLIDYRAIISQMEEDIKKYKKICIGV